MAETTRHNYKNLKIWKLGMERTNAVINAFPSHEKFDLRLQLSRCSISIPSNVAEASSRTGKSFSHFINIALSSSFELETQLLIAYNSKY